MNILDNPFFRLFGLILIITLAILVLNLVINKYSSKKIFNYVPSILVFILGIGIFIYSKTLTEGMLDLAFAIMSAVLIISSILSAIVTLIINIIDNKKVK